VNEKHETQCPKCNGINEARRAAVAMLHPGGDGGPTVPLAPRNAEANERYGIAQMLRAPGKTFTRQEVLAVLRSQLATVPAGGGEERFAKALICIFEAME
jgi:hypothetical protein